MDVTETTTNIAARTRQAVGNVVAVLWRPMVMAAGIALILFGVGVDPTWPLIAYSVFAAAVIAVFIIASTMRHRRDMAEWKATNR
jgi:membrane protein YdbS with pleckstrin-like domain